jgi:hypothetical protein
MRPLLQFTVAFIGSYFLFEYLDFGWALAATAIYCGVVALAFLEFWPDRMTAIARAVREAKLPPGYVCTHVQGFELDENGVVTTELTVTLQDQTGARPLVKGTGATIKAAIAAAVAEAERQGARAQ